MLIYFHIPFCDSKCNYCSFNSFTNLHYLIDEYFIALNTALEWELSNLQEPIESIFIGGGTPSVANFKYYEKLFNTLFPYIDKNVEITIEANPNSATKEWLEGMHSLGINRISFGVQSFDDNKLKALNRAHNSKEAINAVENAHKVGFENISLDIIYDTYLDTNELLQKDINLALSLPINHISTYELIVENLPWFKSGEVKQNSESFNFFVRDLIANGGLPQYEVSNYGTYRCKHNIGYWQHKNYLGIGAGAVGFKDNFRYYPKSGVKAYIQEPLEIRKEYLSSDDILTEKIMLGLRSCVGVDMNILTQSMQEKVKILIDEEKLEMKNGIIYAKELFLADEISLFIMQN